MLIENRVRGLIDRQPKLLVEGVASSGKTLLAVQRALDSLPLLQQVRLMF